jgi:hypothetical protein
MTQAQRFPRLLADRAKFHRLTATFASAANSLTISPVPEWIVEDAELVLSSGSTMEGRTVASVVGTTVTFDETNTADWPAGTRLHAGLIGWVSPSIIAPNLSPRGVRQANIEFDEKPGSSEPEGVGTASTTLGGREVFLRKPDVWVPMETTFAAEGVGNVDFGFGTVERYFMHEYPTRLFQASYTNCSVAKATEIEQMFNRLQGRRGEFYMPTWAPDLVPVSGIASAGTTITVEGTGVDTSYDGSTVYKGVAVRKTDGSWLVNTVSSIAPSSGNSVITVGSGWSETVALGAIDMVCWLPVWRFATDSLTMVWVRETVAQTRLSLQMIEALTVES